MQCEDESVAIVDARSELRRKKPLKNGKKWFGFTLVENTSAEELIGRMGMMSTEGGSDRRLL